MPSFSFHIVYLNSHFFISLNIVFTVSPFSLTGSTYHMYSYLFIYLFTYLLIFFLTSRIFWHLCLIAILNFVTFFYFCCLLLFCILCIDTPA
uniref:Uncharacterized protein n=1 Tax=Rhipicephalus pulchellus TaxID=72859 RepID=L7LYU9_RHIPC